MKKLLYGILLLPFVFSGCATTRTRTETTELRDSEILEIKMKQVIAMAETSMEISRNAEEIAQQAFERSTQAEAASEKAIEHADKAGEAANEARKFAEQEVQKAVSAAEEAIEASKAAMEHSDKVSKTAMEHSDRAAERAIAAANRAIQAANEASERAIAAANQTIAEVNRLRATIKIQQEQEPILREEPIEMLPDKTYTVKRGDTLSSIAQKHYRDSSKWRDIYNANKDVIKNPDSLIPGTRLVLP